MAKRNENANMATDYADDYDDEDATPRQYRRMLDRHPDCRDPDHPGCPRCDPDHPEYEAD